MMDFEQIKGLVTIKDELVFHDLFLAKHRNITS